MTVLVIGAGCSSGNLAGGSAATPDNTNPTGTVLDTPSNRSDLPRLAPNEPFVDHVDPLGFSLVRPASWTVAHAGLGEIAAIDPAGTTVALVRARVVRGDLLDWLTSTYLTTEVGVERFTALDGERGGPDAARALLRFVDGVGMEKHASVVAVRQGDLATVFAAIAPTETFTAVMPVLATVLDSFRFTQIAMDASPSPAAAFTFVPWVEPFESAWSMEVPAGWRSEGGLLREADGVRAAYRMLSPDGTSAFFGGDTNHPRFFVLTNPIALSLGFREGEPTAPGGPIMLSFQDAATTGQNLVQQRFGSVTFTGVFERPDLLEMLRRNPTLPNGAPLASAAEITFTMPDGRIGMYALTTAGETVGDLGGTWRIDNVHGFLAPPDQVPAVAYALAHAIASSRENPQWRQGEAALQADLARQWSEYLAFSQQLQQQTIIQRWASDDAINRGRRDILGGTVRVVDPQTGEGFQVAANDRFFFRVAGDNTVVGTDVDLNPMPDLDLRRLLIVGSDIPDR